MKIIKYQIANNENPDIQQILHDVSIGCRTQAQFDANYPIAEREAVGEITVEGEFDDPSDPSTDLAERVTAVESDVADLMAAIEKGLAL